MIGRAPTRAGSALSAFTFLKADPAGGQSVAAAGAGEAIVGVCMQAITADRAAAGGGVAIAWPGDRARLLLGGSVKRGDYLKSDANSAGVAGLVASDHLGARALTAGGSGDVIDIEVYTRLSTDP